MSALGEYVHLNVYNYKKYGTARVNSNGVKEPLAASLAAQKRKNLEAINSLSTVSDGTLNTLKERIEKNDYKKQVSQAAMIRAGEKNSAEKIQRELERYIAKEIGKTDIFQQTSEPRSNDIQINEAKMNIERAREIRNNIYKNIKTFNETQSERTLNTIYNNFQEFYRCLGATPTSDILPDREKIKEYGTAKALTAALSSINLAEATKASYNGFYGEACVFAAENIAATMSEEALVDYLVEQTRQGLEGLDFAMNPSLLSKKVQKIYEDKTGVNLYQIHQSQNKLDASITLNGENIDATVKAYTATDNIAKTHLQDINLMYTLAATADQFGNHWINLHASSMDTTEADEVLKDALRYEALVSGNPLKQGSKLPNTFVAIDIDSGKVYTKTAKEMLLKEPNTFTISPKLTSEYFDFRSQNKKKGTVEERISTILQAFHEHKLSVSYKVTFNQGA
jgi:hypothetical protein